MLLALDALNKRGVVHCDLKSENVLIRYNSASKTLNQLKIIDFGAAFNYLEPSTNFCALSLCSSNYEFKSLINSLNSIKNDTSFYRETYIPLHKYSYL